jgi:hypothetical protein
MRTRPPIVATVALVAGLIAAPSLARDAPHKPLPRVVAENVGAWRIYASNHATCALRLTGRPTRGGYALVQPHPCSDAFPLQSVVAWKPFGALIVFTSETGAPILTFQGPEDGVWVSDGDPAYSLRAARDDAPPRSK